MAGLELAIQRLLAIKLWPGHLAAMMDCAIG
jgi:hypothetical protein